MNDERAQVAWQNAAPVESETVDASGALGSDGIEAAFLPPEPSLEDLVAELNEAVNAFMVRIDEAGTEYLPPDSARGRYIEAIGGYLAHLRPDSVSPLVDRFRQLVGEDLANFDTWKGLWFVASYTLSYQADMFRRRLRGEFETDEWGMDPEFRDLVAPFLRFLYTRYWRVETTGIANVPSEGRALLVSNHSGQLPFDGAMIATAMMLEHPAERLVRSLYADWFPTLPVVSSAFVKLGQTLATVENGVRLLEEEQLVAVYPEGIKGVGKLYKDRYRLARFGRGGFVRMALATQSPMIPVSVVGAEETYVSLYKSKTIAKLIGFPFFPFSPTWPWLGPLGLIPMPTKWYIDFGAPVRVEEYEPEDANNLVLVSQLSDRMRTVIQQMIIERLAKRRSVFSG